jgi:hypothetical protein
VVRTVRRGWPCAGITGRPEQRRGVLRTLDEHDGGVELARDSLYEIGHASPQSVESAIACVALSLVR